MVRQYFVYILASHSRALYVGVTNDLGARLQQHRSGVGSRHCSRYEITKLVWWQEFDSPVDAIQVEKRIKAWRRAKKVALIQTANPAWRDLAAG